MANFTRPTGVECSNYIYPDKKNTFEKLKEFLFDGSSGRTDVVFLGSAATATEPNQDQHTTNGDTYHYTGGLIDGLSKAIIQGSATRTPRPMYATGIQFAYTCNKIPNFDRWNNATWLNANTTGVGGYLTGCSTVYSNYYYYKLSTDSVGSTATANTGFFPISLNQSSGTVYSYFDEVSEGGPINLSLKDLWAYSFFNLNDAATNSSSKLIKGNSLIANSLTTSIVPNDIRDTATSLTSPFNATFTLTPEQPQRYWDRENSWYINSNSALFSIGIGYVENDVVTEVFSNATTYGYTTGISVGQTVAQAKAAYATGKIKICRLDTSGNPINSPGEVGAGNPIPGFFTWWPQGNAQANPVFTNALLSAYGNKQILYRILTIDEIITIRSLNIAANNSTITSYSAWKAVDGFRVGDVVVLRSPWANPLSLRPQDIAATTSYIANSVDKKFGLATASDLNVSTAQVGLPYLYEWGNRTTFLSQNGMDFIDFGINRASSETAGPSPSTQLAGFPKTLSTIAPCGFFRLSSEDSAKISDPSYVKYKERGLIVKPNLGKFFNSIVDNAGQKEATTKFLSNAEKDASISLFKSANFKYCVNVYGLNKYAGDALSASSLVVLTAHSRNAVAGAETQRAAQNFTVTNTVIPDTTPRQALKNRLELNVNLSSINSGYTLHELRFCFLGKGQAGNTNGDLMITTHYGIDTANQHGIAFSKLNTTNGFRTGDSGYQDDAGVIAGGRYALYIEYFRDLYARQTDTTLGAISGIAPKLVIMFEIGVWELANPNISYNGYNSWTYLIDEISLTGNASNGMPNTAFGFDCLTHIINAAIIAGFTRNNIVVCFYTPTMLTKVDTVASGSINGINYTTELDEAALITTKNNRSTFVRASEIFKNTFLQSCGYYNPCPPAASLQVPNPAAKNSCYINFGSIPNLVSTLNSITGVETSWYDNTEDILNYRYYSEGGALAIGSFVMDYIAAEVSNVYFVPPWIIPFSSMLNYTTDPVSGADLNFVTVSLDPLDIEPYLFELDLKCDQGNEQAKRTLSKFKTKILQ